MAYEYLDDVRLPRDPQVALDAATKQYVDTNSITQAAADTRYVNVIGDTMTGDLLIDKANAAVRFNKTGGMVYWVGENTILWGGADANRLYLMDSSASVYKGLALANPTALEDAATKQYADGKLALSGGTLTGNLTVKPGSGTTTFMLDASALENNARIVFRDINTFTWSMFREGTSKQFIIGRYDDGGSWLGAVLVFGRDTGYVSMPGLYNRTTTSAANVYVTNGGDMSRSTSSFRYKHDILGLDGVSYPDVVPVDRRMKPATAVRLDGSKPNYRTVLDLKPVQFVGDQTQDGLLTRVGLIAEDVEKHASWALSQPGKDAIEWPSVTAALLQVVKDQQAMIKSLEQRVAALEGVGA